MITTPPLYSAQNNTESPLKLAYSPQLESVSKEKQKAVNDMKLKRARDLATSPLKTLPMNFFMLWMAGSGVQIFSVMITTMMLYNPLKALFGIAEVFKPFQVAEDKDSSLLLSRLLYVLCQIAALCLGVWKLNQMGLIPNTTSDFLAFEQMRVSRQVLIA
ncbi:hypothetical protein MIR68_010240 [Amoeboaphelidium protococcarum]|nr:hypothetical protein MIR68_010240 [Amoeboaphelidium protococcarum]